jgi:murein DD-endopeptidase MepM/ murein hydrolase activator NlpD
VSKAGGHLPHGFTASDLKIGSGLAFNQPFTALTLPRFKARRSFAAQMNLGMDPPLEIDGQLHSDDDHRRISVRWLTGTALTGLAGALLISAAIFAAFDRKSRVAEQPEWAAHKENLVGELVNPRKGDRILRPVDVVAAKQTFKASTSSLVGDREVVRVRNFTRVATNLVLASVGFSDEVPKFNPLKLLSDSRDGVDAQPEQAQAQEDADIAFSYRGINEKEAPSSTIALNVNEAQAQVSEYIKSQQPTGSKPAPAMPAQLMLMRTSRASLDINNGLGFASENGAASSPFSSIEVHITAENVSNIKKSTGNDQEERLIIVRRGETLDDILRNFGATRDHIKSITSLVKTNVVEGQKLKILLADITGSDKPQVARLIIYRDENVIASVAINDRLNYVLIDKSDAPNTAKKPTSSDDDDEEEDSGGMRLYDSLYETALKQELPRSVIDDLVRVFGNDVDFQRTVGGGDSFEAFYTDSEDSSEHNDLLYASIKTRSETYKYYRFQTPDDSQVDYYDETGRSSRKFLIRKPISFGEQRSGFGMRRHPILGYTRMHTGVDWAAPIGTPIFAAGNGTVIKAGRESGYGNRVEIQHANGYITTYNHMSGFARGIKEGVTVRQGQTVGFLGMTGLATGPHLHYEVIVNGHFVDPLRVKLARTRELDQRTMAAFQRERQRIESLMAKAPGNNRTQAN